MELNFRNKIINADVREGLKQLPDESVDCCITSTPYWSLRDYGISPSVWDGDSKCLHEWEDYEIKSEGYANEGVRWNHGKGRDDSPEAWSTNIVKGAFCKKCNAWKGCLGLEPSFELFVKHLCDIYDEVWRVLKKNGTNWVNIGDCFSTISGSGFLNDQIATKQREKGINNGNELRKGIKNLPSKCLLMTPYRFAIEMINRGWILRNIIIWSKPSCMPSSTKDRFTVDFEPVFFFAKSRDTQYWTNERTGQTVVKQPPGTKGEETIDWAWILCPKCEGKGIRTNASETKIPTETADSYNSPRARDKRYPNGVCKRCKGTGQIKHNFWAGHDYYFDQNGVRENHKEPWRSTGKKESRGKKYNNAAEGVLNNSLFSNGTREYNPLGRNRRCVWTVTSQPNPENHFATFPMALVSPMIIASAPKEVCSKCGLPRERLIEKIFTPRDQLPKDHRDYRPHAKNVHPELNKQHAKQFNVHPTGCELTYGSGRITELNTVGWSKCDCNAPFVPGVVLDIFGGTGTTGLAAWRLGRDYTLIDISKEYCKIMERRLKETKFKRVTEFA